MAAADPAVEPEPDLAAAAARVFGDQLPLAVHFAELLTSAGIERGLLGPREAGRIWDRHLLNCAALAPMLPPDARVVDVGSGAGLPGLALAIRRPDLRVDLVESLRRRTDFLAGAVASLGLQNRVRVVHGRVEERDVVAMVGDSDWVTARAVAPLDRLVRWCLPLLRPGGFLLALKGERAPDELAEHGAVVRRAGGIDARVVQCPVLSDGDDSAGAALSVIVVQRGARQHPDRKGPR